MKCYEFLINNRTKRKQVKRIHKHVVNFLVIFVKALSLEVKEVCHLSALVVTPQEENFVFEADLNSI